MGMLGASPASPPSSSSTRQRSFFMDRGHNCTFRYRLRTVVSIFMCIFLAFLGAFQGRKQLMLFMQEVQLEVVQPSYKFVAIHSNSSSSLLIKDSGAGSSNKSAGSTSTTEKVIYTNSVDTSSATRSSSSNENRNTKNYTRCELLWDWPMLDGWKEIIENGASSNSWKDGKEKSISSLTDNIYVSSNNNTAVVGKKRKQHLVISRSNVNPTSRGEVQMSIEIMREPIRTMVVLIEHRDAGMHNVWHRMAVQYMGWMGTQVAMRRLGIERNNKSVKVIYVINCWKCAIVNRQCSNPGEQQQHVYDIDSLQGWSNLGETTCLYNQTVLDEADVVIEAPNGGLLWDLAWDNHFNCGESSMFNAFVDNYRTNTSLTSAEMSRHPQACFISRKNFSRDIVNSDSLLEMMRGMFSDVRELYILKNNTTEEISFGIRDCSVIFGVHGAGLMNTIYARRNVAVIELSPNRPNPVTNRHPGMKFDPPSYYRNINMLLGHYYDGLLGNYSMNERNMTVDIDSIRKVLERAKSHAESFGNAL